MLKRLLALAALFCALATPVLAQTATKTMPQAWEASTPFAKHLTPAQLSAVQAGMSGDSCATKADLLPLFVAAETDVSMQSNTPYALGAGTVDLVPGCYWFSGSWSPHHPLRVRGVSAPGAVGGSVILNWPANTPGIILANGGSGNPSGFTLENVSLIATKSSTIDPLGTQNAVTASVTVTLKDVNVNWWAADCLDVNTSVSGVADFSRWQGGHCLGNNANSRYCTYAIGNDSNAVAIEDVLCTNVGGMGFVDASGTGGNVSNGGVESSGFAAPLYLANQGGASFRCVNPIPGQCKTTTPGTNSLIWAPIPFSAGYGAYSSAINYIGSGALYGGANGNKTNFSGVYVENSDPSINVQVPAQVMGGTVTNVLMGSGPGGGSPVMSASASLNIVGSFHTTLGGWAATDYSSNGTVHALDAAVGGNGANGDVLSANNVTQGSDVYRWHYAVLTADLYEDFNNDYPHTGRIFTGPNTTFQFGRGAAQAGYDVFPKGLFLSNANDNGNARFVGECTAMPTTGTWALGDRCLNSAPSVLGSGGSQYTITGWLRITTGSGNVLNTDWVQMRALTGT